MLVEPWAILEIVDASMQHHIRSSDAAANEEVVASQLQEHAVDIEELRTDLQEYMSHLLRKAKCAPLPLLNPEP